MPPKTKRNVVFLNARTCGIYKNGGPRFKTDPKTGKRTTELDNQLDELVDLYLANKAHPAITSVPLSKIREQGIVVPTYYDRRYEEGFERLLKELGWSEVTLGELIDDGTISVRGGHGSPGNDQRTGTIPYIKVSDIRALRVNTNPTNLVTESVARHYWHGPTSGLKAFDLITPNRASSNIGEFAVLLPGEEQIVITKEVFVLRVHTKKGAVWDAFGLHWALCLRAVRDQWRRIALMQTNREDCGDRHREIRLPLPPTKQELRNASKAFRDYFTVLAQAKQGFLSSVGKHPDRYIASVFTTVPTTAEDEELAQE